MKAERALVGICEDLIIDFSNGKFMGLLVREGFGKKHLKTIAEKDIEGIGQNFFLVKSYSVLGETDEIVRIKEILDKKIRILQNKVVTVSGQNLGKVYDYTLDLKTGYLSRLYVRPTALFVLSPDYIINFSQIISIERDKIIVEDATIKSKDALSIDMPESA